MKNDVDDSTDRPALEESADTRLLEIGVAELRAALTGELSVLFSQFEHDQGPAEYEVDYIVGSIVERGMLLRFPRPDAPTDSQ